MNLEHFLRAIANALEEEDIPAMLTGSVAAALRGAARATMDIDIVIQPTAEALERFVGRIVDLGYYASSAAALEALATHGMFNVIDAESGWKADLIIRKMRPFSETEFARREATELLGVPISVARIEDLIVAKLEWAALGASTRQLEDVRALLRIGGTEIDEPYIHRWVQELGLTPQWDAARQHA